MAKALTIFGALYGAKEDAKMQAQMALNIRMVQVNALAKERMDLQKINADESINIQ